MAFLSLQNIGKIYVSEGNVAVGIRGVSLDFERGEFVAITGESGSGKSTLLNVISGMDAYEEGELLIEGEPTSHYLEADRETYREKYISFIFQDYNILESFTVLQNVELALMSIPDKRARRARALELIRRVGLEGQLHQKGSRLSGGQKQRTVIARALAKDSPIILADEPTGNLDSASSAEIIALLREVSKDKLLIVVTHDFEEVADYATREVRIYDGAVESDHSLRPAARPGEAPALPEYIAENEALSPKRKLFRNGMTLGRALFTATPKLTLFLCLLLVIGALGLFSVTSSCGEIPKLLKKSTMFTRMEGRVIVTRDDGKPLPEAELKHLETEYGARDALHLDLLLDADLENPVNASVPGEDGSILLRPEYGRDYGNRIIGRYPEAEDEAFLYLSVEQQPLFGKDSLKTERICWYHLCYKVVGVKYYYDNNLESRILLTREGFEDALAAYVCSVSQQQITAGMLKGENFTPDSGSISYILPSFELEEGQTYIASDSFLASLKRAESKGETPAAELDFVLTGSDFSSRSFMLQSVGEQILAELPASVPEGDNSAADKSYAAVSIYSLRKCVEEVLDAQYRQGSLFFDSDRAAAAAAAKLRRTGYIAVTSDTTYTPPILDTIMNTVTGLVLVFLWVITVLFLAFFIHLCSGKAVGAFKHDLAILRSMGIPARTVCVGLFARLYLSLIPALLCMAAAAAAIFRSPKWNSDFVYLHAWQYVLLVLGLILITARVGFKQVNKLFGESVRKALRGGEAE